MGGTGGKQINLKLKVWRQKNKSAPGEFKEYDANGVNTDASFLEMLDVVNEGLVKKGEDPIAFDHDCREGICGSCAMTINGNPHGPEKGTTVCQLHMRKFKDGESLTIEPFRATAFPVLKDLSVDRSAFDKIIAAGGYVSIAAGNPQDANCLPIPKENAELAFLAAQCISCGACVAACANSSAMLFVGAKVAHLGLLPQGQPERESRVLSMMKTMEDAGFGNCSNTGACSLSCPKEIDFENIVRLNRDFAKASLVSRPANNKSLGGAG